MKNRPHRIHVPLATLSLALTVALLAAPASAQTTYTWDGGGSDALWTTAANWNPDGVPADGPFNFYQFGGTTNLSPYNNLTTGVAGGVNVDQLTFLSGAGAFDIQGSTYLDMLGSTSTGDTADIVNNSTNTQTISLRLEARPDFTTALVFNTASGDIDVTGSVTSSASSNYAGEYVRKTGTYTLTFSGNNTYGSATQVNQGALRITSATALGSASVGTTVASNARLELSGGVTVTGETVTINGNGGTDYLGALRSVSGTNVWAGPVVLGSGPRIGASGASTLEISGAITGGSMDVRTTNDSAVILSSDSNDYGSTRVVLGVLKIAGGDDRLPTDQTLRMGHGGTGGPATFDLNGFNQEISGLLSDGPSVTTFVTNTSGTLSTLTVNNSANYSYGGTGGVGVLAGNLALVKDGTGTQTLGGNNTFTGGVTIDNGILELAHAGALNSTAPNTVTFGSNSNTKTLRLGGQSVTVAGLSTGATVGTTIVENGASGGATLTVDIATANTFGGVLQDGGTGTLALTKSGAGTLTLTGDSTFTGETNVVAGVLETFNGGLASDITIHDGAIFRMRSPLFDSVDDNATVTVNSGGRLEVQENDIIGGLLGAGTVDHNITGSHWLSVRQGNFTGVITDSSGTLQLRKEGSGTLILTGDNTYSGGTLVQQGVLQVGNTGDNGFLPGNVTVSSGATLRLSNPGADAIGDSATVTVNFGGLMDVRENENIGGLVGDGTVDHNRTASDFLGIGFGNFSGTITDAIGSLRIDKNGSGVLTLSGDNSYSGGTIVNAGTLRVNNTTGSGTGSGAVTVSGGTLGGTGIVGGPVTVNSGSLAPGASPGILTLEDGVTFTGGSFAVELNGPTAGTDYDQLLVTGGDVNLGSGVATLDITAAFSPGPDDYFWIINNTSTTSGLTEGFFQGLEDEGSSLFVAGRRFYVYYEADLDTNASFGGNDVLLTSVPEPSTLAMLLGLGGLGLLGYLRRRRRS